MRRNARGLEIVIPAPFSVAVTLFLAAWSWGWWFAERWILLAVLRGPGTSVPLILFLVAWTLAGLWTVLVALWMVAGREVVEVDATTLCLRREVLGIGVRREYPIAGIRDLRVVTTADRSWGWTLLPRGDDGIAFDHRGGTAHFGTWLNQREAGQVVEELRRIA